MVFCPNPVDWTALGTVTGAAFTGLAAVGTIGALVYAIRSTSQARADTRALQREVAAEKRTEQAAQVCAWLWRTNSYGTLGIRFSNTSPQPVYEVVAYTVWVQGAAPHTGEELESLFSERSPSANEVHRMRSIVQVLPHGEFGARLLGPSNWPMQGVLGVEVAFTDGAGRSWVRRVPNGELVSLDVGPIDHYGIARPLRYDHLEKWDGEQ